MAFSCSFDDVCLDKRVGVIGNSSMLAPAAVVAPEVPAPPGRSCIMVDVAPTVGGGIGGVAADADAETAAAPTGFMAPTDFRYATTELNPTCSAIVNAVDPSFKGAVHMI